MDFNEFFRDESKVQGGEWVSELTGFDPSLRLKVRGLTSKDYMAQFARRQRTAPAKDREPDRSLKIEAARKIMADLLPEYILLDWDGITDGGKPVPFKKETAAEWLKRPGSLPFMNAILEAAGRVDDIQATEEKAIEKN